MRILVISDTHGNYQTLERVILGNLHADAFIHLGDGEEEISKLLRQHPELEPKFHRVRGNCDFMSKDTPNFITLTASDGHRIFATHGHSYWVYYDCTELARAAQEHHCDIALYGHTHVRKEAYLEGVHILNPGSASKPRDGKPASYAWIDTSKAGVTSNILPVDPEQANRSVRYPFD